MSISRHDRFTSVEQFRSALWQVMRADQAAAQILELAVVATGEEQTTPDANPLKTESLELTPFIPVEGQTDDLVDDAMPGPPIETDC